MMAEFLVLRLSAPLQSWGEKGRLRIRDTSSFPTKSGILGLLGCALGVPRDDPQGTMEKLGNDVKLAIRADQPGTMLFDYQTAQVSAYHRIGDGSVAPAPTTLVLSKYYLQDADFTVFLAGSHDTLIRLQDALKHPVFPLYLGRKCCIASHPILDGIYEGELPDLLQSLPRFDKAHQLCMEKADDIPVLSEFPFGKESAFPRQDVPLRGRQFTYHDVYRGCISYDPV